MKSSTHSTARSKALADAMSGVGAALVALWVFYPIDVLKTHVQAGRRPPSLRRMMSSGLEMKSVHTASSSFFYFYLYSWILSWWTARKSSKKVSVMARLILSAVAAMINTCLTLPLDVISARHQTMEPVSQRTTLSESVHDNDNVEKHEEELFANVRQRVKPLNSFLRNNLCSLWKGLGPSLILCSNPAINYTVFDTIKSRYTLSLGKSSLTMGEAFLLGLFSKFIATIATYPLIRAKVMLMVTSQNSMLQCIQSSFKERGIQGLYEGCNLQLLHTMLKSALLMMVRERISEATQRLVVGKTR